MITQREYVEGCLLWYREADLQPGNPQDGEWHECHYPVPKCLGGTKVILLLEEHHAVQGVLQSEENQRPCIYGWEKQHLEGQLLDLWQKWMEVKAKPGLAVRHTMGWSDESRQKVSRSMTGEKNHNYGKPRSEEVKRAISNKTRGRQLSEERKQQISKRLTGSGNHMFGLVGSANPAYGKKWWVNANGETKLSKTPPGPEWQKGRRLPPTN